MQRVWARDPSCQLRVLLSINHVSIVAIEMYRGPSMMLNMMYFRTGRPVLETLMPVFPFAASLFSPFSTVGFDYESLPQISSQVFCSILFQRRCVSILQIQT